MTKQHNPTLLTLIGLSLIWFLIGWITRGYISLNQLAQLTPEQRLLATTQKLIADKQYPLAEISSLELAHAAIRRILSLSKDPYAAFFPPAVSARFQTDFSGETGVPGLLFEINEGHIRITDIFEGRSAALAGLQVGDIILGVDGIAFDENTFGDEASVLLRGPVGTSAHVMIQRAEKILEFDVKREEWKLVSSRMIGEIGYIHLSAIPGNAAASMQQGLQELLNQKMRALIWDLRGSGGGSMQATQTIVNDFIRDGVIYNAVFKNGKQQAFVADGDALVPDLPLVVLIDQQTYSSSEMAAAAIREHGRGTLIGQTTTGKSMIQDTIALDQENLLRISVAKWLSPSGQWLQGKGVIPTIEMIDNPATPADEVLNYAVAYLQQALAKAPPISTN